MWSHIWHSVCSPLGPEFGATKLIVQMGIEGHILRTMRRCALDLSLQLGVAATANADVETPVGRKLSAAERLRVREELRVALFSATGQHSGGKLSRRCRANCTSLAVFVPAAREFIPAVCSIEVSSILSFFFIYFIRLYELILHII